MIQGCDGDWLTGNLSKFVHENDAEHFIYYKRFWLIDNIR